MKFTYDAYCGFVDRLRDDGYELRHLDHPDALPDPSEPWLMLRHDIDLDLDPAVEFATVEQAAGISSDYYVLTTSPFYNPFSARGREAIAAIVGAGHRIGLHFDSTVYGDVTLESLNAACVVEAAALESIVGAPLVGVSFHRPLPGLIGAGPEVTAPYPHTYLKYFISEMEYCTDSTGRWRYGPPDERPAVAERKGLHLVTHPIWWGSTDEIAERRLGTFLERYRGARCAAVAAELAVTPQQ